MSYACLTIGRSVGIKPTICRISNCYPILIIWPTQLLLESMEGLEPSISPQQPGYITILLHAFICLYSSQGETRTLIPFYALSGIRTSQAVLLYSFPALDCISDLLYIWEERSHTSTFWQKPYGTLPWCLSLGHRYQMYCTKHNPSSVSALQSR